MAIPRSAVPARRAAARIGVTLMVVLLAWTSLSATATATLRNLRVLDFNIHTGIGTDGRLDLDRTADVIRASGADIVGLQEVDVHWAARSGYADQAGELARMLRMRVFFAPIYDLDPEPGHVERRRYGVAILSRHPILATWNHPLTRRSTVEPGAQPAPGPGFAEAEVWVRGKRVHVYATHLDFRPEPEVRAAQVAETTSILDDDGPRARQVLAGDLNAEPSAPELGPLLARTGDTWARANGTSGGLTYPADVPVKRIDYIAVDGPIHARSTTVLDTQASDHRPVLARLLVR